MESVHLQDKLEHFYNRFILSIYSKDLVHFCLELIEYQVDNNQASVMFFFFSLALTISAYFLPVCTLCNVHTNSYCV